MHTSTKNLTPSKTHSQCATFCRRMRSQTQQSTTYFKLLANDTQSTCVSLASLEGCAGLFYFVVITNIIDRLWNRSIFAPTRMRAPMVHGLSLASTTQLPNSLLPCNLTLSSTQQLQCNISTHGKRMPSLRSGGRGLLFCCALTTN